MESTENSEQEVRRDYILHRTIIRDSFFAYLSENKRYPSNNELARRTGLSEKTIRNHLKNFDLAEITEPSKLFAENVLMSLIKRIQRTGDPSAVKLYLFLVFGIDERGNLAYRKKEEKDFPERLEGGFDPLSKLTLAEIKQRKEELLKTIYERIEREHEGNNL